MFQRLKISQLWISASVLKLQVQVAHFIPIKLFLSSDNSKNLVYPSFYVPISKLIPELLQLCPLTLHSLSGASNRHRRPD